MRRCSRLAPALALLAAATLTGCASHEAKAAGCVSPGVTPNEVRIGLLYPDSGVLAPTFSSSRAGIDARIGLANERGGVHGRKIVYDWQDDRGTADANSQGARTLVERQNVFGVIESSFSASGSAQYLADRGVPVTGIATENIWSHYRNMFSFSYTDGNAVDTFGTFVHNRGGKRVLLVQAALSASVSELTSKYDQSIRAAGLDLAGILSYSSQADNPAETARRIAESGADTVIFLIQPPDYLQVLSALRGAGRLPGLVMAVTGYDRQLLETAGAQMAGLVIPVFYRPFELGGAAVETYEKAVTRFAPQIPQAQHDFALMSYVDTDMFIRGLEAAGPCPTRRAFIDGLRSVTDYDADGLIAPIDIAHGLGRTTNCYSFVQVNPTGTAFDVVDRDRCGREITP
ncbi:ABC transporter substrate-binding protein [Frankia sp. ACN1ag]|uniref:ABC transporter substrate-binding protein n=1 Tax=Frankia sp. ACN1ag TaxID=102891 RepID=UPI0006DD19A0|nr:ABC transporter substrate-binding protein [Frankia sp. ACN1ag]KQC36473.1 branched-chain amino acid ABC transporter substrate-binding protein [Frankia sp. ACN1ag]